MASTKRTCLLCRKKYEYCGHCSENRHMPSWYNLFHNENCSNIWGILTHFENGDCTSEEAREKLSNLDTTVIKNESALRSYHKLFDTKEETPAVEKDTVETTVTEESVPVEEEVKVEESAPVEDEDVVVIEGPVEEKKDEETLSVSQELKKHNNYRHNKYNKKN